MKNEERKSDAVEMDEMMAAMVLTSLSCSPVVQSPPGVETNFSGEERGPVNEKQASPKYLGDAFGSPQTDNGFETDPDAFLLDEPAPRKRKNSVKVMYKCLWPNCGKVLRSIVGIKRHVKALHLGDSVDSGQFKREEDFYYTEVQTKEEAAAAGGPAADPAPSPSLTSPPLAILPPPPPKAQSSGPDHPGLESYLPSGALSKSAPGSFWHIQADHAYQALPSFQIPVSPHIYTSISWAAAPSTASSLSPVSVPSSEPVSTSRDPVLEAASPRTPPVPQLLEGLCALAPQLAPRSTPSGWRRWEGRTCRGARRSSKLIAKKITGPGGVRALFSREHLCVLGSSPQGGQAKWLPLPVLPTPSGSVAFQAGSSLSASPP
ncbi:zinc finger domain-containing protein, partial [Eschrichtius robustus]|nr:zinc finger domain-containing protein [Eschrichtius robustus]